MTEDTCSGVALSTLFDVLCWQIRLRLLDSHSIYCIGIPVYDADDNRYRIVENGSPVARVSFKYLTVNRTGYGGLTDLEREQLPDRGMFPPQALFMMSSILVEGDESYVSKICDRFHFFLHQEMDQVDLLKLLKKFARKRLVSQYHPWFALDPTVAAFHSIESPRMVG